MVKEVLRDIDKLESLCIIIIGIFAIVGGIISLIWGKPVFSDARPVIVMIGIFMLTMGLIGWKKS